MGHLCCQATLLSNIELTVLQGSRKTFPTRVAPQTVFPQPVLMSGGLLSQRQDFAFVLVEFHEGPLLSGLLQKAVLPSSTATGPPRLVSSANFLGVHCVIPSRSLIMMLNRTGPGMGLCITPAVTGLQGEYNPLTIILSA